MTQRELARRARTVQSVVVRIENGTVSPTWRRLTSLLRAAHHELRVDLVPTRSHRSRSHMLDDVPRIAHLPGVIVQGRYDVVCPAASAWELHKRWPGSRLRLVGDAGHSIGEPGIAAALVEATDELAARPL